MYKKPLSIEIVRSENPLLSAMAKNTQLSVLAVLKKHYTKVKITNVNVLSDLQDLVARQPDLVVLGMKFVLLEPRQEIADNPKIWLSDYLNSHGIAFTGSDTGALELEYDKHIAKQAALDAKLDSPRFFISEIKNPKFRHNLSYPLFIKPANRNASKGIDERSLVRTDSELKAKIISIHATCNTDALIEEYLPGREFSVAVIRQPASEKLTALPIEITMPSGKNVHSFLSESIKKADTETTIPVTDKKIREAINNHAIGVFKALQSQDYGRIDVRLDAEGAPNFIEVNLTPGLSTHGYLFRCFSYNGHTTYDEMILMIVSLALERTKVTTQPKIATILDALLETRSKIA